jgi:hypothetical protein
MKKIMKYVAISLLFTHAAIAAEGGNGPGNGTDAAATPLAIKKVLSDKNGLSVEERIYDLWIKAENSIPNTLDGHLDGRWTGLTVNRLGTTEIRWGNENSSTYAVKSKYQKGMLTIKTLPALKYRELEIKPATSFAYFQPLDNFNGNMNPIYTYMGVIDGIRLGWVTPYFEGMGASADSEPMAKPIKVLANGIAVQSLYKSGNDFEYRQLDDQTLVGIRKIGDINTESKPACPHAEKVMRKQEFEETRTRHFLGVPYQEKYKYTRDVFDHWEVSNDFGVPNVCEVHLLVKYDDRAPRIGN